MAGGAQAVIKEPQADRPAAYARRVHELAAAYAGTFLLSLAGAALIIWRARLLVTLSQRSNVETLTLAFFLVFFLYLALLTVTGAWGAVRVATYALRARLGADPKEVERRKVAALPPAGKQNPVAALNVLMEREHRPGEPVRLRVADDVDEVSELVVMGAELREVQRHKDGSNSLLAFFVEQVNQVLEARGAKPPRRVDVVAWKLIDDEQAEQYLGLTDFAHRLQRHLDAGPLWPTVTLTDADCQELERRLSRVCPALRDEAFLPHWEYEGQHKLPLVPEPLGLVQLGRSERRVDPVTSMGCALLVVVVAVVALGLIIAFPPWVPGA